MTSSGHVPNRVLRGMLAGMVFAIAEITLNVERIVWLLEGGEDGEGAPEEEDA